MQSSLGHLAIFLIIFEAHMNILVNIKVEIMSIFSFSLNDHIAYLFTNTSIFEPRMFSSSKLGNGFLAMFVSSSTTNQTIQKL